MSSEELLVDIVDKLYDYNDNFISRNGIEKAVDKDSCVRQQLKESMNSIAKLESLCRKTVYSLQYGRALNIIPEYSKECEDYLSKAVKRDPSLIEGWNLLGETFWKKGDISSAKDCFEGSLKREKNKVALRSMSMVLRQIKCSTPKDYVNNVIKSVESAKEAVGIDADDGMTWYILGNAYLSLFFATDHSAQTISLALGAYEQAEKVDSRSKFNSDLHYNRAQACRFHESYCDAFDGWQQAINLDPKWQDPVNRKEELLKYLIKVNSLVQQKGKVKAKRLQKLMSSLNRKALGPLTPSKLVEKNVKIDQVSIADLKEGMNPEKMVLGSVVCNFADVAKVPYTFALVDSKGTCCAVTVYNLAEGKGMIIGDTVAIAEPYLNAVDITLPDEEQTKCNFTCLRVNDPTLLIVNGRKVPDDHRAFITASLHTPTV